MATIEELAEMVDDPERKIEEYMGWKFGQRVILVGDDEEMCLFEGEEGNLVIQKVGAAKYHNERIDVSILVDGTDCPMEIRDFSIIEPYEK